MRSLYRRGAAVGVGALVAAVLACDAVSVTGPGRATVKGCEILYDTQWPANIARVISTYAASCPIRVYGSQILERYSGTVQAKYQTHQFSVSLRFVDNDGSYLTSQFYNYPDWKLATGLTADDTLDVLQVASSYFAARAMRNNASGADTVYHTMTFYNVNGGNPVSARFALRYEYGPGFDLIGPGTVLPDQSFSVYTDIHDPRMVEPVTYAWTLNDYPIPGNGSSVWGGPTSPGAEQHYAVTVTDVNGLTGTADTFVRTKTCDYVGCNDQ